MFHSVAAKYDLMNDLMSGGLHRVWKMFTIAQAGVRPGFKVLDIAGGTGDLAKVFAKQAGPTGEVWLTDINESMLRVGRDRLLERGLLTPTLLCDAEKLPFPDNYFDRVSVAFGLRNMTHKDQALAEMRRVLKPGGKLLVLEFSKVAAPLQKALRPVFFQGAAVAGPEDRRRRRQLPLPGRIDPHASGPGNAENNDGTGRPGRRPVLQSDGWRGSFTRGDQILGSLTHRFLKEYFIMSDSTCVISP